MDDACKGHPYTSEIQKRFNKLRTLNNHNNSFQIPEKDILYITFQKGRFLRPCPGTLPPYICCGYWVIDVGYNCPMTCNYCILQAYFKEKNLIYYSNIENLIESLNNLISLKRIFRIGTGEFTDSMALDPLLRLNERLIPLFSKSSNLILELKTKAVNIDHLFDLPHRDKVVISWSLASHRIITEEERGTASLLERIKAAERCQREGYVVGFHFDPIIEYEGWEDDYKRIIDALEDHIDPKGVIWISLGTLRFMPELKWILFERHRNSRILKGEFIRGMDGKLRYFKPLRIDIYAKVKAMLDEWSEDLGLYLCMETEEVWKRSFGWSPGGRRGLCQYLDQRTIKLFHIKDLD